MNDDFSPIQSDNGESSPAKARKPLRRARRTVAPFSELTKKEASAEKEAEAAEFVPAVGANEPATEFVPAEAVKEPAAEFVPTVEANEPATEFVPTVEANKPATEFVPAVEANEPATEFVPAVEAIEPAAEFVPAEELQEVNTNPEAIETAEAAELQEAAFSTAEIPENRSEESDAEKEKKSEEEALSPAANAFDWVKSFLFSLTVVIFVFTLLFRGVTVNGDSMLPTLNNSEYLIISDLLYTPKTGDIVVVQSPHYKNGTEPLIKRIIATGGQKVKINFQTWEVWVDGKLLHEDYILRDSNTNMHCEDLVPDENNEVEFTVEENCVFVMGDHRNDSLDSRSNSVGQIDKSYIMGRVLLRLTPFDRFGKVE